MKEGAHLHDGVPPVHEGDLLALADSLRILLLQPDLLSTHK